MFGVSPALLIRGVMVVLVLGLATSLYLEIKKAGANEQKIENLNQQVSSLSKALEQEQRIREADQITIKERDETINKINASHRVQIDQLNKALGVVRQSDKCIDTPIPEKIQDVLFGPAKVK